VYLFAREKWQRKELLALREETSEKPSINLPFLEENGN
jgi:hypothetical protein